MLQERTTTTDTNMKTNLTAILSGVAGALILSAASATAGLITVDSTTQYGHAINVTVPDGNSGGISSILNVSGAGYIYSAGDNVSVTLNISSGYNGDLYAYVLSPVGTRVQLLDRPGLGLLGGVAGVGYTDAGFSNVTLSDGNSVNVNSYGGGGVPSSISYNPSAGGTAFQTYNGQNANGNWVLFISDLNGGDLSFSRLDSWSLTVAVPEPVDVALGIFGGICLLVTVVRNPRVRALLVELISG